MMSASTAFLWASVASSAAYVLKAFAPSKECNKCKRRRFYARLAVRAHRFLSRRWPVAASYPYGALILYSIVAVLREGGLNWLEIKKLLVPNAAPKTTPPPKNVPSANSRSSSGSPLN